MDNEPQVEGLDINSTITAENLTEGPHTLKVWGCAGEQWQIEPTSYTWNIDLTPPVAVLQHAIPSDLCTAAANMEIEVGGDDVASYEYMLDNDAVISVLTCDTRITLSDLAPGVHHLQVFALDKAGNRQLTATSCFWNITPDAANISLKKMLSRETNNTGLSLQLTGKPGLWYQYRLDNKDWSKLVPIENLLQTPKMKFIK